MKIFSWNVNGLRACTKKGFLSWLDECQGHIVGLQEVRARLEQLPPAVGTPENWHAHFSAAERAGYSGVAIYGKIQPNRVETSLGEERFDCEGRVQIARFGRLVVANVYFPNGSGRDRDNSRVPYKLDFYRALFDRLQKLRRGGMRVVVIGDFNTAHREIDLARPKANKDTSGFLAEEREELDRWLRAGWVDTFRQSNEDGENYTWWSQRFGTRARNVGWRIDYALASPSAMRFFKRAWIDSHVMGSDHCPIGVEFKQAIIKR
jgi:exodeoxyribonuclease III